MNEFPVLEPGDGNIVLFHPHVPVGAAEAVRQVLGSRWIGQGPRVAEFERRFAALVAPDHNALAVGSGTDALHLAYLLAGLVPGDEVIAPVFTCTATNIPLLYMGNGVHASLRNRGPGVGRGEAVEGLQRVGFCGVGGRVGADINSLAGHIIC